MANLKNSSINDTGFLKLPAGTTSQRPGSPNRGMLRYNTDEEFVEFWDGSIWTQFIRVVPEDTYGTGAAGDVTTSGTVNTYAHVTSSTTTAGSTTLTVNNTAGMNPGERVFIHQTQNAVVPSEAGNWEMNEIVSVGGNTITLKNPIRYTYRSNTFNTTNQVSTATQVVVARSYSTLTLNGLIEAKTWDGFSGGIVFITATEEINCNGNYISAWGKGFRGGRGTGGPGTQSSGFAGESIRGHLNSSDVANDTGGGGADGDANAGGDSGASGGHATSGGRGEDGSGIDPEGGGTIGSTAMTQIFFGGAGGRGGDNDSHSYQNFMNPDTGADDIAGPSNWNSFFGQYTTYEPPWGSQRYSSEPDQPANGGGIVVLVSPSIPNLNTTVRGGTSVGTNTSVEKNGSGAAGSIYIITKDDGLSINNAFAQGNAQGTMDGDFIGQSGSGRVRIDIDGGATYSGSATTGGGTIVVN